MLARVAKMLSMHLVKQDLTYALRRLRRAPGFAAVAILSLALGIGATTAMFTVIDAVDLTPSIFADPDRLVVIHEIAGPKGYSCAGCITPASHAAIAEWRAEARSFSRIAAWTESRVAWNHGDEIEPIPTAVVSSDFFATAGVRPLLGRVFEPREEREGGEPVIVLSYDLWRERFAGDSLVVGSHILDGEEAPRALTVIGVMPRGFRYMAERAWLAYPALPGGPDRGTRRDLALARLKPGVTLASANAELAAIAGRASHDSPATNAGWGARALTIRESKDHYGLGSGRFILFGIVCCVLFVALVNVAALMLIRAAARRQEVAVRRALGASRGRIAVQQLVESLCVAVPGGILGTVLGVLGAQVAATRFSLEDFGITVGLDARVLVFVVGVSLVAGVVAGLAPALSLTRGDPHPALGERAATGDGRRWRMWGSAALLVTELALGLVLLNGAGLLSKELYRLRFLETGYDSRNLYFVNVSFPKTDAADRGRKIAFARRALSTFAALPAVRAAGIGSTAGYKVLVPEGRDEPLVRSRGEVPLQMVTDTAFLRMSGVPLVAGRWFGAHDVDGAPPVALVNEAAAARYWPGRSALGRRISAKDSTEPPRDVEVVGVVANAKIINTNLRGPAQPIVYYPFEQYPRASARVFVRVRKQGPETVAALRGALASLTGRKPWRDLDISDPMDEHISAELTWSRFNAVALDAFAAFALLLSAMGLYASMAALVHRRTREIGIRMALGAQRRDVLALVSRHGLVIALAGAAIGLAGSFALTRVLRSMLYGTSPRDPAVFAATVLGLFAIVVIASYLPARRAAGIDPMVALRYD